MRGNKSKHTKPELLLRKALWASGLRGYRLHFKKLAGSPDIVFSTKKNRHICKWLFLAQVP
jgi:DNA mismatch endonuclease (patch repair protein)